MSNIRLALDQYVIDYDKRQINTQTGGKMRKTTTRKKKLHGLTQKQHTEATLNSIRALWSEVETLKVLANEHKAKIHNLNGDTTTIFNKLADKKPSFWSRLCGLK